MRTKQHNVKLVLCTIGSVQVKGLRKKKKKLQGNTTSLKAQQTETKEIVYFLVFCF